MEISPGGMKTSVLESIAGLSHGSNVGEFINEDIRRVSESLGSILWIFIHGSEKSSPKS
jgi:hypothetical protein